MSFPEYEELERPLLCFIYHHGGNDYAVHSSDTYNPLADHFALSKSERNEIRKDGGNEPLWNNMVQWARRKLNEYGYLQRTKRGVWKLSAEGIEATQRNCG